MIEVVVGDETIIFPDGMSDEEIQSVLREQFPQQDTPKDVSWFDEAMYSADATNADYENWALALEAKLGLGEFRVDSEGLSWDSAEELYGPEWESMSYPERKEFLMARDKRELEEEYADVIAFQEENGKSASADIIGSIAKTVATPTSAFVLGKGLPGATVTGSILGAETELAQQVATGDYSAGDLVKATAVGAGGGALANKVEKVVKGVYLKRKSAKHNEALTTKTANLEREVAEDMASGKSSQDALASASARLGLQEEDMIEIAASGKYRVPSTDMVEKVRVAKENLIPATQKNANLLTQIASPISSRIKNISAPVFGRLRKMEFDVHEKVARHTEKSRKFIELASKRAKDANYGRFERALMNNNRDEAKAIAAESFPELAETVDDVAGVLDELYKDLAEAGVELDYAAGYFPRKVKDMEGLMSTLNRDARNALEGFLDASARKKGLSGRSELTVEARDTLTNQFLGGDVGKGLGLAKSRRIDELDEAMQKHYYSAPESLMHYINKAAREAEKRRFFGKHTKNKNGGEVDLDESVGSMIAANSRGLSDAQLGDLRMMLQARFNEGEQASNEAISTIRNIQTAALLGQFDSATIQLGDVGTSLFMNGLVDTAMGIVKSIGKRGITNAEAMGVVRNIAADVESNGLGAKVVDKALKYSGFRAIDRLGKDTLINAAHRKNMALARKKPEEIVKKWGEVFGEETADLIKDLRSGANTDNVRLLLFNELSDAQPITLSEMPQSYLESPNGRIFYALKSFSLKQLDLVKRTAIDEIRKGNVVEGFSNLMRYGAWMGVSGATVGVARDAMQTKEVRPEQFTDKGIETLMGIMFMNDYARTKFVDKGDMVGYLQNLLLPAGLSVIQTGIDAAMETAAQDEERDPEKFNRIIKDVPVVGKAAYYWMFGGAERKLDRERKEEIKQARREMGLN